MANSNLEKDKPVICLVHGRYHGGECWNYVREELDNRGYQSLAPTLNIENPALSMDDHAAVVSEHEDASGAESIVRVGWSWGANIILRKTVESPVQQLQFVAPSLQDESMRAIMYQEGLPRPPDSRYTILYEAWKRLEQSEKVDDRTLARGMAHYIFYSDVIDPHIVNHAIDNFRSHPRYAGDEPDIKDHPHDIPKAVIVPTADQVMNKDWMKWQAQALDAVQIDLEGSGHSPMYSMPKKLARHIIAMTKNVNFN